MALSESSAWRLFLYSKSRSDIVMREPTLFRIEGACVCSCRVEKCSLDFSMQVNQNGTDEKKRITKLKRNSWMEQFILRHI